MNRLPPLPLIDGAFFVSSSFLEEVQRCSRASQFYKLDARVLDKPASALNFGKHLHSALEMHYRLTEFNLSQEETTQRVETLLAQAFTESPNVTDDHRTLNWATELYKRYAEKYQFENFDLLQYKEPQPCKYCLTIKQDNPGKPCPWCNGTGQSKVMSEVSFAFKLFDYEPDTEEEKSVLFAKTGLFSIPIYYHGYLDLPVSVSGQIFILDFKTAFQLGNSFFEDKKMKAQQKGYCYGLQETTSLNPAGFIIRAIRSTAPPLWLTKGEETSNRPRNGKEPKKLSDWWNDALQEERFYLGDGELEEWKLNSIALVEEFFWHYQRGYFPKKDSTCAAPFRCQYFDVCSTFPASDRDFILKSGLFKDKETRLAK